MPNFKIPNEVDAFNVNQAEPDSRDFDVIAMGFERTGVLTGCAVTAGAGMTVTIAAGTISFANSATPVTVAGGSATIEASHPTLPRFDLIMVNSAGSVVNPTAGDGKGTANAEPVIPTVPGSRVVLAIVYVPAAVVSILSTYLIDKRVMLTAIPTDEVLSGTLAARPAPSIAGRLYTATDIKSVFTDDVTKWRHVGGRGAYDSFDRANADLSASATADSGHTWVEDAGDVDIVDTANLQATTSTALATVDMGAPLDSGRLGFRFLSPDPVTALNIAALIRYVDTNNYLYIGATATKLWIRKVIGGTDTPISEITIGANPNTQYQISIEVYGPILTLRIYDLFLQIETFEVTGSLAETMHAAVVNGTKVGLRFGNFGASSEKVIEFYCIPN